MGSRTEDVLTVIANGETTEINPRCRKEQFLKAIANGDGTANLPEPKSREEQLLMQIAEKGVGGGGTTIVTEDITITPTTSQQVKTRSSGKYINKVTVEAVTSSIDSNIQAENIKKDVTILGVTGTMDGGITPSGTLNISTNGTHNVTNYESANVNVPIPDGYIVPEGDLEVTENGTHDVTTKKTVTVNVESSGGGEFFDRTFANNTPEQISKVSALIAYNNMTSAEVAETFGWNIGDTTKITLSTGEVIEMRIIGFNHDTRTGGGKAGITLDMTHCLATRYPMYNTTASTGYDKSTIKTLTLPTIKATLPQEWQNAIKLVDKKSANGNSKIWTETVTTSEDLFLLAEIEIFGKITNAQDGVNEGSVYEYWNNASTDDINKKRDTDGDGVLDTGTIYWLRSHDKYEVSFTYFCAIGGGVSRVSSCTSNMGVSFAFCV